MNLGVLPVDLVSASGHKFHGPKGVGLLYIRDGLAVGPLLHGGGQEGSRRAGTEHVAGIVGFARALTIAKRDFEQESSRIRHLQYYLHRLLAEVIPGLRVNGDPLHGLYTVLSVSLPKTEVTDSLLWQLDTHGICVSGGSACSAGANSHVMTALGREDRVAIRFSMSKWNTEKEVQKVAGVMEKLVNKGVAV